MPTLSLDLGLTAPRLVRGDGVVAPTPTPTPPPSPTPAPTPTPSATPVLTRMAFAGDSISAHAAGVPAVWAANNSDVTSQNFSQGGAGIGSPSDADADGANSFYGRLNALKAFAPVAVLMFFGANDVLSYGGTDAASYAASFIARYKDAVSALRASGVQLIGAGTLLPNGAADTQMHNDARVLVNVQLRAGVGDWLDYIVPFGEHPLLTLANFQNSSYSDGNVHPNAAGYAVLNEIAADVLGPIKARSTATTPTQFAFTDLNNQAAGSTAIGSVRVTGMGIGRRATQTMTGAGDMATGQGAFGTAARDVMNGDVALRRLVNSASADTAVDGPLTIGTTSDTFTVRTASASPPVSFAALAGSTAQVNETQGSGPVTFAAIPFPAGRPVVALFKENTPPTGVTINGVAATLLVSTDSAFYLYAGPANQALAAGDYDIVVSAPATSFYGVKVWAGAAANSTKAIGQTAKLAYQYRGDGDHAADAALTVGIGGQGVIFYLRDNDTPAPTFVNGTTVIRYPASTFSPSYGLVVGHWGTFNTSQTPAANTTQYGNDMLLAAVLP
ncbi:SGNH/GDSL hydrolase family protein [Sphingomonas floccifaciens]|uniref:SGNH/GDSL hydrolase family protein n=1 Tax=Sphingomonas floccifaciens TaxID=1844115 RepID=A0ABW4NC36_9SPHN